MSYLRQSLFFLFSICTSISLAQNNIFCYYTNWARFRPFPGDFNVTNIDPFLCTHIVYAFANITDGSVQFGDELDPVMYNHLQALKLRNPTLKSILSIGGFAAGSEPFSNITTDEQTKLNFANSAIKHLRQYGFDGLDIDWEYPLRIPNGKEKFTDLIMYMNAAFTTEATLRNRPRLLLTAAVSGGEWAIDSSYNIPALAIYLDYVLLLTYDYHGSWENATGLHSAFVGRELGDTRNVQWAINKYKQSGMPKEKIIMGIPTFGRTWTLSDPNVNGVGAAAAGPGAPGEHTQEMGILGYNEICVRMEMDDGWKNVTDPIQMTPYAWRNDQWIGFEDPRSAALKANYIAAENLAGAMFWSLAMDDFRGLCGPMPFPIISTVKRVFNQLNIASRAALMARAMPGMQLQSRSSVSPMTITATNGASLLPRIATQPSAINPLGARQGQVNNIFANVLQTQSPATVSTMGVNMNAAQLLLNRNALLPQTPTLQQQALSTLTSRTPAMTGTSVLPTLGTVTQTGAIPSVTTGASSMQTLLNTALPATSQTLPTTGAATVTNNLLNIAPNAAAVNAATSVIAQSNLAAQMVATASAAVPSVTPVPAPSQPQTVVPVIVPATNAASASAVTTGRTESIETAPRSGLNSPSGPQSLESLMKIMEDNKPEDILNNGFSEGENWGARAGLPPLAPLRAPAEEEETADPGQQNPDLQHVPRRQAEGPPQANDIQPFLPGDPNGREHRPFYHGLLNGDNAPPMPRFRMRNKFVFHERRPDGVPTHGLITQPPEVFRPFARLDPFATRNFRPRQPVLPPYPENFPPPTREELAQHLPPPGTDINGRSIYHGRLEGFSPDSGLTGKEIRDEDERQNEPDVAERPSEAETYVKVEPESVNRIDVSNANNRNRTPERRKSSRKERKGHTERGRRPIRRRKKKKQQASGYTETVYSNIPAPSAVQCPDEFSVFRDPFDCAVYYRCEWNKPKMFRCQPGLMFDPEALICNWPNIAIQGDPSCVINQEDGGPVQGR